MTTNFKEGDNLIVVNCRGVRYNKGDTVKVTDVYTHRDGTQDVYAKRFQDTYAHWTKDFHFKKVNKLISWYSKLYV